MKLKGFIRNYWFLVFFLVFAFLIRTYNLPSLPIGIHGDEASIGYNAYSLLKTSHDQNGNLLPISIDQFGDHRPAGYHYLAVPFVALLDLNELSTRLPSAIFGSLTIVVFYFFLNELFRNKKISIIGTLLLTISPWHIVISRATSEGVIAAFFIISGLLLFLKGIQSKKYNIFLVISGLILLFVSFFFYHSARFFVPVILVPITLIPFFKGEISKKFLFRIVGILVLFFAAFIIFFQLSSGVDRPLNISILNLPGGAVELKHAQDQDGTQNPLITRSFHNKLFFYGRHFATSYFQHFDGDFLFVNNGLPIRYKVPWMGNLYPVELLFILFGFAVLLSEGIKGRKYNYLIPVIWVFIAAIPAGLTWEDIPNIQRSSLMLYGLIMIGSFGIYEIIELFRKKILKTLVTIVICVIFIQGVVYFCHMYYYHSLLEEPWHRSAAVKELIFQTDLLSQDYKTILMTTDGNNNLIHYLFYKKYDPQKFQNLGSPKEHDGLVFENIKYSSNPCPILGESTDNLKGDKDTVYIEKFDCKLPKNAEVLNTIRHPDGTPAFIILKLNDFDESEI